MPAHFGARRHIGALLPPTLDLNFAGTRTLDPRITFTRASGGTQTGPSGNVELVGNNVPRFTHDPVTGQSLGLLIEESRTNLLLRSEEFDNASWTKTRASVSANAASAPDGASTADKFIETATSGDHNLNQPPAGLTPQATYTYSIWVRAAERTQFQITMQETGVGNFVRGVYDLSAVTAAASIGGTGSGQVATIQPFAGGWFRCVLSGRPSASTGTTCQFYISLRAGGTDGYTGDGTSGVFVWGAQLEAGAFATSYIPTTGASATRAADVATITGTNLSSWYRQDQGTVAIAFSRGGTTGQAMRISDGTSNNRLQLGHNTSNLVELTVTVSGAAQGPVSTAAQLAPVSAAFAYALNNVSVTRNAAVPTLDTTSLIPAVDQIEFGAAGGVGYLNGTISRIRFWPRRLPDSRLQTLSA